MNDVTAQQPMEIQLDFALVKRIAPQIVEVQADTGIEITKDALFQVCMSAEQLVGGPFMMLINRQNAYSMHHEAMMNVGNWPQLQAIAILVFSVHSAQIAMLLKAMPRIKKSPIEIFSDRQSALMWLQEFSL